MSAGQRRPNQAMSRQPKENIVKKIVVTILLLIGLALPAASYWLGNRVEGLLAAQQAMLAAQYGASITLVAQKQGIFSSTYRYRVADTPGFAPASPLAPFEVTAVVAHGPIPFAANTLHPALAVMDTSFAPVGGAAADWGKLLERLPELRQTSLRTFFGFAGDSQTRLAVPPVSRTLTLEDGNTMDVAWQAVAGRLDIGPDAVSADLFLDIPSASLTDKASSLALQGLVVTSATKRVRNNLYLGAGGLTLTGLSLNDGLAKNKSFALSQLAVMTTAELRGDVVDSAMTLRCDGLALPGQGKATLDAAVSLNAVDAAALDAAVAEFKRINLQKATPEARLRDYEALLRSHGAALAAKGPRLGLDRFVLGLPSGTVEGTAFVAYAGGTGLPESLPAALARLTAAAHAQAAQAALVELAAKVQADNPLLAGPAGGQMVEAALAGMVAKGFAVRDADRVSTAAAWDGRTLTVNGTVLYALP